MFVTGDVEATISPATLRPLPVTYNKRLFRPPFSGVWHIEGDELRGPQEFTIHAEVVGGLDPHKAAERVVSYARQAATIRSPFGTVGNAGVLSARVSPIPNGYDIRVTFVSVDGLRTTDLFVYAPNVQSDVVEAWVTYLEGLDYTVQEYPYIGDEGAPLSQFRAGVVLGGLSETQIARLALVPVPIISGMNAYDFGTGESAAYGQMASASIAEGQESHPTAAGLSGAQGIFTGFEWLWNRPYGAHSAAQTFEPDAVRYVADSVRVYAMRSMSSLGYRRVGFPFAHQTGPSAYHPDGLALVAAAVTWTVEGSSAVVIDLRPLDVTTFAPYAGSTKGYAGTKQRFAGESA